MTLDASNSYIERAPHDRNNHFTLLSNSLIRDRSISPACFAVLSYLLSHDPSFKIKTSHLLENFQGYIGRDQMYKILNEAIAAGYMIREEVFINNLKKYVYKVAEFKKFFRYPDPRYTENQDTLKEITNTINNKTSSSKSSSSFSEKADDAKKAVVKAPAQRTLPPEPVAKPVASASLPSQPASCSKSSVADAPLADELSFSKKFREKYPEDVFNKKAFKQAYNQMKGKKDVNVPLAYVKTIYDRVKQELEASEKLAPLVAYHRKLAETALDRNMGMGSGGCYFIEGDSYVHQSGTGPVYHKFGDATNPLWNTLKYILKL